MTCLQAAQRLIDRAQGVVDHAHRRARTETEALAFLELIEAIRHMRRVLAKTSKDMEVPG